MLFSKYSKLSLHSKIAICVAPILVIFGFAASDLWVESKAQEVRFFTMEPENGKCDVLGKNCVLKSGEFQISVYEENGLTTLNTTFPLDTATLFFVDDDDSSTIFRMGMKESPYYWYQKTPISETAAATGSTQKIRLVATIKGGQYISEFVSTTAN